MRAAEEWIRTHVEPTGPIHTSHVRPWSTVWRVPLDGTCAWFKECALVQVFEPRLSGELATRWPDVVADVIAFDEARAWLLLADAGEPITPATPPDPWLTVLPAYAELQRGEIAHAADHLEHRVPDLRLSVLPERYDAMVERDLPLEPDERRRLRAFAPRLAELCDALASCGIGDTVQHDDLHGNNVYSAGGRLRVLDWGDSSISHPFFSLTVPFRFLDEQFGLPQGDAWYARLRAAYLEPWGDGLDDHLTLALRLGWFAHAIAWTRQRDHLPGSALPDFDDLYPRMLRRALALTHVG